MTLVIRALTSLHPDPRLTTSSPEVQLQRTLRNEQRARPRISNDNGGYVSAAKSLITVLLLLATTIAAAEQKGTLKVTSFPSGAGVTVDGQPTGKTTPMSMSLAIGNHTITVFIANSGWTPDTRTV